jgi:NAD(P)H-dependent flavin oxidoreductase YrpB (nitropropane dioxygenase family)
VFSLADLEHPIVQAPMGGGPSTPALAAAVSEAGGLGTIGILAPDELRSELAAAWRLTDRPIALNVLLPFARRGHWAVAAEADVVVTFWGRPTRRTPGIWIHQCGSADEAAAAYRAGADAVIAQGVEAGGHVRGTIPALDLLERVRADLPDRYPVLLAGGLTTREDVSHALEAGARAAVLGTRFLLTEESRAHPEYKRRLLGARETVLTELFGAGWPRAPHRVVANEATRRWLRGSPRGPGAVRALNALGAPFARRLPASAQARLAAAQRPGRPILSPQPPADDGPENLLDAGPLYAGETVARIDEVRPAGALTRELVP